MELSAEIDRGDVWYDETPPPFRRIVPHRPTLVLYVDDDGTKRPLVRWPTTIGGWADQRLPERRARPALEGVRRRPARVARHLSPAPTWLPPKTTPDKDLVKNLYNGHWALKSEIIGPGPHAAYGMVLLEHLQRVKLKDGTERFDDNGIGTHGSAERHLDRQRHQPRLPPPLQPARGPPRRLPAPPPQPRGEGRADPAEGRPLRIVFHNDESFNAEIDTRGFLYELTPPVPVNVLKGHILSKRKIPPALSAPASN